MKKFNANIPGIIGIVLAVSITSCNNERIKKDAKNPVRIINSNITYSDVYKPVEQAEYDFDETKVDDIETNKILKK